MDLRLRCSVRTGFWSVQEERFGSFVRTLFGKDICGGVFLGLVSVFLSSRDWVLSFGVFIGSVEELAEDGEHSGSSV